MKSQLILSILLNLVASQDSEEPPEPVNTKYILYAIGCAFGVAFIYQMLFDCEGGRDPSEMPKSKRPAVGALQTMKKDDDENILFPLSKKIKITDDTYIYRFSFDQGDKVFGLPVGNHVIYTADINGEEVERKYTPISKVTQRGYIDFLIKVYYKNVHPKFPEGGLMT